MDIFPAIQYFTSQLHNHLYFKRLLLKKSIILTIHNYRRQKQPTI